MNRRHRPGSARRLPGRPAVLLAGALALTACTGPEPGPGAGDPEPGLPVPPLYEIYRSGPATDRIALAEHRLLGRCMTAKGFDYRAAPPATGRPGEPPTPFGYETLPPPPGAETPPAHEPGSTTPSSLRALNGDPARRLTVDVDGMRVSAPGDGCLAEAGDRLLGESRAEWMRLRITLFHIENRALRSLEHDARLRAATDRWRECVRGRGYSWSVPTQVQRDLPVGADPRTAPGTLADLECKERTRFLPDAYASLAEAQLRELGPEPTALTRWRTLLHAQDAVAKEVLEPYGI